MDTGSFYSPYTVTPPSGTARGRPCHQIPDYSGPINATDVSQKLDHILYMMEEQKKEIKADISGIKSDVDQIKDEVTALKYTSSPSTSTNRPKIPAKLSVSSYTEYSVGY